MHPEDVIKDPMQANKGNLFKIQAPRKIGIREHFLFSVSDQTCFSSNYEIVSGHNFNINFLFYSSGNLTAKIWIGCVAVDCRFIGATLHSTTFIGATFNVIHSTTRTLVTGSTNRWLCSQLRSEQHGFGFGLAVYDFHHHSPPHHHHSPPPYHHDFHHHHRLMNTRLVVMASSLTVCQVGKSHL